MSNMKTLFTTAISLLSICTISACAMTGGDAAPADKAVTIWWEAQLYDGAGDPHGQIMLSNAEGAIIISGEVTGIDAGEYGMHLHMVGRCDAPDFKSAGGHWNPTIRQHGKDNPHGAHAGDLGNLLVGENGVGVVDIEIGDQHIWGPGGLMDDDGAAIVIHAGVDDNQSDPSGNSGARMLCGIVGRVR